MYVTASLGAVNKSSRNAEVGVVLSELGSDKTTPSFIMGFIRNVGFFFISGRFYNLK